MTLCSQRLGDVQLGVRRGAREDHLAVAGHDLFDFPLVTVVEPLRVDDDEVLATDPDLAGDRRRGQWMIAGDDDDPDPCAVTAGDRVADLGTRRVEHRDQTEEAQLTLGLLARGDRCTGRQVPPSERQHAQPFLRVRLDAMHDALALAPRRASARWRPPQAP